MSACLCLLLAVSMASCSSQEAQTESGAENQGGQKTVRDEAYYETVEYSDPITISYCTVPVTDGVDYNNDDEYAKWWTEKFNIQWDIISVESTRLDEMARVWINSGDMPDLLSLNYNHSDAINYVDFTSLL